MTDTLEQTSPPPVPTPVAPTDRPPESQSQRWVKYGANVALTSILVVALAVLLVYLAQKSGRRLDTTASGTYSLKPQTTNLIKNNKQKIEIISLYTRVKPPADESTTDAETNAPVTDLDAQATAVDDLLQEYKSRGSNITVDSIDPTKSPTKIDALITEVSDTYGGEVKKYRGFTDSLPKKYEALNKAAGDERDRINAKLHSGALPVQDIQSEDVQTSVRLAFNSINSVLAIVDQSKDKYSKALRVKVPDYKGVTADVSDSMTRVSEKLDAVIKLFGVFKDDKTVPQPIRDYMATDAPAYVDMKRQADALIDEIKGLGELKLDSLRDALRQKNPILVRGEKEWKVVAYDQVWKTDTRDARSRTGDAPLRPRFAGEQAVTTAILALEEPTKPKVCFVRAGGYPNASEGGKFSAVADRLRSYNYDVSDKDLTGQYAMQAQQAGQPAAEPADADIADAIWVVDGMKSEPQQQNPMMPQPPASIAAAVGDHLAHGFHVVDGKRLPGGCAMIFTYPEGDTFSKALDPFGVSFRTDAICVHPWVHTGAAADDSDDINSGEKRPFIFPITNWGVHPITESMTALPGVAVAPVPVTAHPIPGVSCAGLIPLDATGIGGKIWGETDISSVSTEPVYDKDKDVAGPFTTAAAAEITATGSRVVVVDELMMTAIVDMPDRQLEKRDIRALAIPGNGDFFTNGVFWLGHRETMMAMSPSALSVSRIAPMSRATETFWHVGVLLIGLPGLVLAAGTAVFFARRG